MKIKKPTAQKTKNIAQQAADSLPKKEGCIIFSLQYIQKNHCYSNCQPAEKQALADAIFKRREMTWKTIAKEARHGLGYEKIERKSLNVAVPNVVPEDASILSFRFYGLAPMVGYRENDIFHILWLDREYKVYPH
ncbi:hypothetical protein WKW51_05930 [Acinetobacter baumannii]|uniref:hypothetical protein n=1 Tax=Acinetobacter calcoaceticus/baumannii complex TaxID=909768 RepID=UPI001EFACF50|nr:hypothetical protein [Acinetobacter baumannii]MDC5428206.1 hypothetical protein [Acinetobacter baumannii]HAV4234685.1 hypothetical protein [Acinetobacter baumannii ATCC 17978]